MARKPGRHFLNIPGPTPVPDRILRAMDKPTIDHRGPDFGKLTLKILENLKPVFGTKDPIVIYPSSGTGAWVAALVNTLSPGDKVLMVETGQFATLWKKIADGLGLQTEFMPTDWRRGADEAAIEARLRDDKNHEIKAVCVVHNETSTGCTSPIALIRKAIDAAGHPALYMVDTISSLASMPYMQDEWQVDVTVGGSQKGLMLPPGLSFTGVSQKALKATETAKLPKVYWDWKEIIATNERGYFPYTPGTNMLYGLDEALLMIQEEGLENMYARHDRLAEATRRAVQAWGLETLCANPRDYSNTVTAVLTPAGHSADAVRLLILKNFDMSLGVGLSKVADKIFRIGHIGDTNDLTILGALSGVEMGLRMAGVPHQRGGVQAAVDYLAGVAGESAVHQVAAQ
ncbi:MAG: aminotransferase class V-fold PLP-dependent enzyme [Hyphomicrobiales bacterium]|nr:aminotransferase class V-fold PLP-dependent enzyme [Hyphomicrobiales bacterium]